MVLSIILFIILFFLNTVPDLKKNFAYFRHKTQAKFLHDFLYSDNV